MKLTHVMKLVYHSIFWLGASVKAEEVEFAAELAKRAAGAGGKIKVIDVAKKESEIEVKEMVTLHDVIEGLKEKFPGLTHNRIPVCNSASPLEADFDALCGALIGTNVNCPVIVNCQVRFLTLLIESEKKTSFRKYQRLFLERV